MPPLPLLPTPALLAPSTSCVSPQAGRFVALASRMQNSRGCPMHRQKVRGRRGLARCVKMSIRGMAINGDSRKKRAEAVGVAPISHAQY